MHVDAEFIIDNHFYIVMFVFSEGRDLNTLFTAVCTVIEKCFTETALKEDLLCPHCSATETEKFQM